MINSSFLSPMNGFTPLSGRGECDDTAPLEPSPRPVGEDSTLKKLLALHPNKASGPDQIPSWLLKDNADLLAAPIAYILNSSFRESRLPKQSPVMDVNKHLRPISLTPILSKVAEDYVVESYIKPTVLAEDDQNQFGTSV
ncbi:predicted protein [Nematostella vectensis]|uniref:Uncharacterized protein n=1 Tax=Nematostella vectensis TaxID=45351 RepID=A7RIN1_NEMVE|nr:predicted protein [Nematostella vectensis]|eukprot:XP_001640809.1 predicted protein [Nematostella vectensis]